MVKKYFIFVVVATSILFWFKPLVISANGNQASRGTNAVQPGNFILDQSQLTALEEILCKIYTESLQTLKPKFKKAPISLENIQTTVARYSQSHISKILAMYYPRKPEFVSAFDRLIQIALSLALEARAHTHNDTNENLAWCNCIHAVTRIIFAIKIVLDVLTQHKDPNHTLIYTAFAPGSLLQEYILMHFLLKFYPKVTINLIDLSYPDFSDLPSLKTGLHKTNDDFAHSIERLDLFKTKVGELVSINETSGGKNYQVQINTFQSTLDYLNKAKQEKCNLLTMVDPDLGFFGRAQYISEANIIMFWPLKTETARPLILFLSPRSPQLYQSKETVKNEEVNAAKRSIIQLIQQAKEKANYRPVLIQKLLEKSIIQITQDHEDHYIALWSALDKKNIDILPIIQQWLDRLSKMEEEGLVVENYDSHPTYDSFDALDLDENIVLISFGLDAHLAFQNLVTKALQPNGAAFALYRIIDKKAVEYLVNTKINIRPYTAKNIVDETSGVFLETLEQEVQSGYSECDDEDEDECSECDEDDDDDDSSVEESSFREYEKVYPRR